MEPVRPFRHLNCLVVGRVGILLYAVVAASSKSATAEPERSEAGDENRTFRIAGYLPDYRFDAVDLNATAPFLTDLLLFSASPSPHLGKGDSMLSFCCLGRDRFAAARRARARKTEVAAEDDANDSDHSRLQLWLTVGGGGRSDHFLDDPDELADAIRRVATEQELDGVDLDCESFRSREDYLLYLDWIRGAAPEFRDSGLRVGVALHAGQVLPPDLYAAVDRIHLMAYDLPPPPHSSSSSSGPHPHHADLRAVRTAVERLVESGCPPSKILMGIPCYARHSTDPGDVRTYAELVDGKGEATENGGGSDDDDEWRNRLDDFDSWIGYVADSPKRVREKVAYARDEAKLGGVFLWELGQDKRHPAVAPGGILLEAAAAAASASGAVFESARQDRDTSEL